MKKFIFCDLDGTLLNNDDRLEGKAKEDMLYFLKHKPKDISFVVATGRRHDQVRDELLPKEVLEYIDFYICLNGGMIAIKKPDGDVKLNYLTIPKKNCEIFYNNIFSKVVDYVSSKPKMEEATQFYVTYDDAGSLENSTFSFRAFCKFILDCCSRSTTINFVNGVMVCSDPEYVDAMYKSIGKYLNIHSDVMCLKRNNTKALHFRTWNLDKRTGFYRLEKILGARYEIKPLAFFGNEKNDECFFLDGDTSYDKFLVINYGTGKKNNSKFVKLIKSKNLPNLTILDDNNKGIVAKFLRATIAK